MKTNDTITPSSTNLTNIPNIPVIKALTPAQKEKGVKDFIKRAAQFPTMNGHLIGNIDIRLLDVDLAYQRIPEDLNKLLDHFDIGKLSMLTISYRDGKLYTIDGLHRIYACLINHIQTVSVEVYTDLTQEAEAKLFATQDDGATSLKPSESYKAHLLYGEPVDTAIHDITAKYGMDCLDEDRTMRPALSACRNIVKSKLGGKDALEWIFHILYESKWTTDAYGCSDKNLNALWAAYKDGIALQKRNLKAYEERLISVMRKYDMHIIQDYGKSLAFGGENRGFMKTALVNIASGLTNEQNIAAYLKARHV